MTSEKNHRRWAQAGHFGLALLLSTSLAAGTINVIGMGAPVAVHAAGQATNTFAVKFVDAVNTDHPSMVVVCDYTNESAIDITSYIPKGYSLQNPADKMVSTKTSGTTLKVIPDKSVHEVGAAVYFYDPDGNYLSSAPFGGWPGATFDEKSVIPAGYFYPKDGGHVWLTLNGTDQQHFKVTVVPIANTDKNTTTIVQFMDANSGNVVGTTQVSGQKGATLTVSSASLPVGFHFPDRQVSMAILNDGGTAVQYVYADGQDPSDTTQLEFRDAANNLISARTVTSNRQMTDVSQYLPTGYTFADDASHQYQLSGGDLTIRVQKRSDTTNTTTFRFVDGNNNTVKTVALTGAPDQTVDIRQYLPSGYQLVNGATTTYDLSASAVTIDVTSTTPNTPNTPDTPDTPTNNGLTISPASGVVTITRTSGATLYGDAATSQATGRTLNDGSQWRYNAAVKDQDGNIVAYNVGGSQFVNAADASTQGNVQKGVFTVRYPAHPSWGEPYTTPTYPS